MKVTWSKMYLGSFSDYAENKILDQVFGATAWTAPVTLYLALFTAAPSDSGGGTEVTGGSYARKAVTNNSTNFPNASSGSKALGVDQTFVTPTADWGTVTHVGIFDASSSGNLVAWGALAVSKNVQNGDTFTLPATTGIVITLD